MFASNSKFDLILLDIMMPEIDGIEVLRKIREGTVNKETPVIIMTAYGDSTNVKKAIEYGASDFIVKPIEQGAFLKKVIQVVGARQSGIAK